MKEIAVRVDMLDGLVEKIRGLMFETKKRSIYFKTRWGIHTFFMKYPIDVVILNDKNTVINFRENLKPWRIYMWNPKYEKVLELPTGTIKKLGISINSIINLTANS